MIFYRDNEGRVYREPDWRKCPERLRQELYDYFWKSTRPGSFVYACLCDSFMTAMIRADREDLAHSVALAKFIWHDMPSYTWGNDDLVARWTEKIPLYLINKKAA